MHCPTCSDELRGGGVGAGTVSGPPEDWEEKKNMFFFFQQTSGRNRLF